MKVAVAASGLDAAAFAGLAAAAMVADSVTLQPRAGAVLAGYNKPIRT